MIKGQFQKRHFPPPQSCSGGWYKPFGEKFANLVEKTPSTLQKTKSGYLGLFWALMALGEKATTEYYDSNATVFNLVTTRHLPDTLRHHPDTPRHPQTSPDTIQTPPYLACMRPLGERVISEYHDIYSTGLNLYDIYPPQTSTWHTQTPSWHCQTPSDTIQTPLRHPHIWPACGHWEKE